MKGLRPPCKADCQSQRRALAQRAFRLLVARFRTTGSPVRPAATIAKMRARRSASLHAEITEAENPARGAGLSKSVATGETMGGREGHRLADRHLPGACSCVFRRKEFGFAICWRIRPAFRASWQQSGIASSIYYPHDHREDRGHCGELEAHVAPSSNSVALPSITTGPPLGTRRTAPPTFGSFGSSRKSITRACLPDADVHRRRWPRRRLHNPRAKHSTKICCCGRPSSSCQPQAARASSATRAPPRCSTSGALRLVGISRLALPLPNRRRVPLPNSRPNCQGQAGIAGARQAVDRPACGPGSQGSIERKVHHVAAGCLDRIALRVSLEAAPPAEQIRAVRPADLPDPSEDGRMAPLLFVESQKTVMAITPQRRRQRYGNRTVGDTGEEPRMCTNNLTDGGDGSLIVEFARRGF